MPDSVLAQLGNRVQHALRAFTPDDQKALTQTVRTFPNSGYDLEKLLTSLGIGEAVVTVLSESGAPTPVAWTRMLAPTSLMAPSADATIDQIVAASPLAAKYGKAIDRESAYEMLNKRMEAAPAPEASDPAAPAPAAPPAQKPAKAPKEEPGMVEQVVQSGAFRSMMRSAGTVLGREITRLSLIHI